MTSHNLLYSWGLPKRIALETPGNLQSPLVITFYPSTYEMTLRVKLCR